MSRSVEAQGLAALLNLDAYVEQVRVQGDADKTTAAQPAAAPATAPAAPAAAASLAPAAAAKTVGGVVTNGSANASLPGVPARENPKGRATPAAPAQRAAANSPSAPVKPLASPHPDFVDTEPAHRSGLDTAASVGDPASARPPAQAATSIEPQQSLGRVGPYELRVALHHDGLGQVFKARDSNDGTEVMVTLLDLDASARERDLVIAQMQKSVLAAAALQHPGLARILDAGVVGEGVYIVNEWTEGRSLGMAQRAGWQPTARVAACVVRDLAQALSHAHAHGVLHGGLNPSTVRLDAHDRASVLGLGFAATAHASDLPSMDPLVSGAAPYLAPEQLQGGEVDERTDVHALGVLLYELLAGHRAYPGETVPEVARALMSHDPAPPHWLRLDVPERLSAIAMQALQRNPAARYTQASQVAAALSAWLDQSEGDTDAAREYFVNAEAQLKQGKKKSYWVSAALLAAAAVVVAFTWVEKADHSGSVADVPAPRVAAPSASGEVKSVEATAETAGATAAPLAAPVGTETQPSALPPPAAAEAAAPAPQALPVAPLAPEADQPVPPAAKPVPGTSRAAAVTEVPAGAVQPTAALLPAAPAVPAAGAPVVVAQAAVPAAAAPKAPAAAAARPKASAADAPTPAAGNKAAARDKPKAAADARTPAAPAAVQTGTVQLAVSPWGYVEVGGKLAGASPPLQKLTLPEGTHTITIRNEDFAPYTTTIQVSADKAATVRHRFAQ